MSTILALTCIVFWSREHSLCSMITMIPGMRVLMCRIMACTKLFIRHYRKSTSNFGEFTVVAACFAERHEDIHVVNFARIFSQERGCPETLIRTHANSSRSLFRFRCERRG